MNLNLTLIGQSVAFAFFVWFCLRYIWPPVIQAMRERQQRIAKGLAASERAEKDLQLAQRRAVEELTKARSQAQQIIEQADKRADRVIEQAKEEAAQEGVRIKEVAQSEIEREVGRAREEMRGRVSTLALLGAEKILRKEIDPDKHRELLSSLGEEL